MFILYFLFRFWDYICNIFSIINIFSNPLSSNSKLKHLKEINAYGGHSPEQLNILSDYFLRKKKDSKKLITTPAIRQNLTWPLSPFLVIINIKLFKWELFKGSRAVSVPSYIPDALGDEWAFWSLFYERLINCLWHLATEISLSEN